MENVLDEKSPIIVLLKSLYNYVSNNKVEESIENLRNLLENATVNEISLYRVEISNLTQKERDLFEKLVSEKQ